MRADMIVNRANCPRSAHLYRRHDLESDRAAVMRSSMTIRGCGRSWLPYWTCRGSVTVEAVEIVRADALGYRAQPD